MGVSLGRQLLRSVGGFFGLTEASQRGGAGDIGWQEYAERNIEVECALLLYGHDKNMDGISMLRLLM